MKRIDHDILKVLNAVYFKEEYGNWHEKPLIHIDDSGRLYHTTFFTEFPDPNKVSVSSLYSMLELSVPCNEFVVYLQNPSPTMGDYYKVHLHDGIITITFNVESSDIDGVGFNPPDRDIGYVIEVDTYVTREAKDKLTHLDESMKDDFSTIRYVYAMYKGKRYHQASFSEDVMNCVNAYISTLIGFLHYANTHDRYPVARVGRKKKVNKRHPWKRNDLVTIVYLNTLPSKSESNTCMGGTHEPPTGHKRTGCFYTLRAERYKHHPKYKKEKAMYRKGAWIGDKEAVINGTTYKVIIAEQDKTGFNNE